MIWKYNNNTLQSNPRDREEEPQNIYSNKTPENNKSKVTSSLFLIKMIAKLEMTQSNAYQNKDQHRKPTKIGRDINSNRMTA